jgi:hypothetical protein
MGHPAFAQDAWLLADLDDRQESRADDCLANSTVALEVKAIIGCADSLTISHANLLFIVGKHLIRA